MKPVFQKEIVCETRTVAVLRHVTNYLLSSSTSDMTFSVAVMDEYCRRVPNVNARVVPVHSSFDPLKDQRLNRQTVMRFVNREQRLPADLEESVVSVLPEPFQSDCLRDLSARYDLLAVRVVTHEPGDDVANLNRILKETGDMIAALAPVLADGVIDNDDRPYAKDALTKINDALAGLVEMQARITKILPGKGGRDGKRSSGHIKVVG